MAEKKETNGKHPVLAFIEGQRGELEALQHQVGVGVVPFKEAAPRFRELLAQNPEWLYLWEHFSSSPKHLVRLLVEFYPDRFLAYNHLYRIVTSLDVGESRRRRPAPALPMEKAALSETLKRKPDLLEIFVDFEVASRFRDFTQNPQRTFIELGALLQEETNETMRASYRRALSYFQEIDSHSTPAFKPQYQPRPYQSEAILKGLHTGNNEVTAIGVFDDMRTGKTLSALARLSHLGVKKALIVAPAGLKQLWRARINEYYQDPPGSVIVESNKKEKALVLAALPETMFTIVSYDLLAARRGENSVMNTLKELGYDGMIDDEEHYAKNYREGVKRSKAVLELRRMSSLRHLILLTGTPVDHVRDMDFTAHLLDPKTYPTPTSFSEKMRENPRLSHNELLSKMVRRTAAEVLELPPYQEVVVPVDLTPTQRALYDFILMDEAAHPFTKLTNLRAAVLHPSLVRGLIIPFELEEAKMQITGAYLRWKKQVMQNPNLRFDTDFLVTYGFTNLYLGARFNLKGGVSELVRDCATPLISEAWAGEVIPSKFIAVKKIIDQRLAKGEKIIIFSSFFTRGFTADIACDMDKEYLKSLYRYLIHEFGEEMILKLDVEDGTDATVVLPNGEATSEREIIRRRFQDDYSKRILVTPSKVSSLGIDLSISDPRATGVSEILVELPYAHGAFKQTVCRALSDTQPTPVTSFIIEATNTLDKDIYARLQEKGKLIDMLLDAVPLTDEEEQILEESPEHISGFLTKLIKTPRQNLTHMFEYMLGKSTADNRQFLSEQFTQSQTYEEYLAYWYDEIYKRGYSNFTTEVVRQVVEGLEQTGVSSSNLADWGSGPLVLARALGHPVHSLDLSPAMLATGKRKLQEEGVEISDDYLCAGSISDIPKEVFPDNKFNIGVCSLALDCIAAGEERVQALRGMRNCLVKDGHIIITIPEAEFDAVGFNKFLGELKKIGFIDDLSLSGFVKGINSGQAIFHSWVFVLKKGDPTSETVDQGNLLFKFEKEKSSKKKKEEQRLRSAARSRSQKADRAERLIVCIPDENRTFDVWTERGELKELLGTSLLRHVLDLPEDILQRTGYQRGMTERNGKLEVSLKRI